LRTLARVAPLLLAAAGALAAPPARAACEGGREVLLTGLDADADLLRLAGLAGASPAGSEFLRRGGARVERLCDGEGIGWSDRLRTAPARDGGLAVVPLRLDGVYSSQHPVAANDGLLWWGRGFGTRASGGIYGRLGVLSAAIAPEIAWQQNAWFRTVPGGMPQEPLANPWYWGSFDAPQRFGAGPFWSASPGQSYLRVDVFGVGAGVSTENRWLGPGARTSILLTDAGPGFPHAFLGTSAPVDFGIGGVEVLALWGRLSRSAYGGDHSRPWITTLAVGWEPRWTPGFYVGAARTYVETLRSLRNDRYLSVLEAPTKSAVSGGNNGQDNQLAVAWFRWVLPESALELYGEWGKDDFPGSTGAWIRETERTQGWLLGMQKLGQVAGKRVRVQVEFAKLGGGGYPLYFHGDGLGFTNGGQPLGSYAGPGGILTWVAVDVLTSWGRIGGFAERLERNSTVFDARMAADPASRPERDTEAAVGLRGVVLAGAVELTWEVAGGYRWAPDFYGQNEPNFRASLSFAAPGVRAAP
jgi:hypothetical protein